MLIKITLGVHLLLGIDSVIKNLFNVLNTYTKRSVHLPLNSKRYKEFNWLHVLLFSIFCGHRGHAQKWEGRGREKSAKVALPFPLSFSLPPYPLPLSMPATQATALLYLNACNRLQSYYHALPHLKGKKRVIKFVSQKFNQKFDDYHWTPLCRHSVYWTVPLVSVLHGVHCPCTLNTHNVIKLTAVA